MIVGSGLLARAFDSFKDDDRVLVFASGVSNSSTATEADYAREGNLLLAQIGTQARLTYFSTCSLFDPELKDSGYIRHKRRMEELIRTQFKNHTILRLPNVVGHTPNPHTLCNYIRDRILAGETINVHVKACRYLMGVDRVSASCIPLLTDAFSRGKTLNVCYDQPVSVPDLVAVMEHILNKKAVIREVDSGSCYEVDNREFKQHWLVNRHTPWPGADEWPRMLAKYYGDPMVSTG
jgi:nucleoside-diphosphate-sugar epimerase